MRLSIHEVHVELGADFADWDGWELPAHYGDPQSEYWAARKGVVRVDRSHRTKLQLTGADNVKFLQNILTNEVQSLPSGRGTYAALLSATGKVISDFRVAILESRALLDTEAYGREDTFSSLDKFNLGYDCEITDETDNLGIVTLVGPECLSAAQEVLGEVSMPEEPFGCLEIDWSKERGLAAATDRLGVPAIDLIVPLQGLSSLWRAFDGLPVSGFSALEMLRVEAGIPRLGVDMDESVNPMEAGLQNAVDFDKGCYVGQEVLAKIDSLGHVNRHLVGLRIKGETLPEAGASLYQEKKKVGHLTSAVQSPQLGEIVALGCVHRKYASPGYALEIEVNGSRLSATVAISGQSEATTKN